MLHGGIALVGLDDVELFHGLVVPMVVKRHYSKRRVQFAPVCYLNIKFVYFKNENENYGVLRTASA